MSENNGAVDVTHSPEFDVHFILFEREVVLDIIMQFGYLIWREILRNFER
jgi:hypothetical protein